MYAHFIRSDRCFGYALVWRKTGVLLFCAAVGVIGSMGADATAAREDGHDAAQRRSVRSVAGGLGTATSFLECYNFVDAGPGCGDCVATDCGMCVDYSLGICEQSEVTVCRHLFDAVPTNTGGATLTFETRRCDKVCECATVWPCDGTPCEPGLWLRDAGGSFITPAPGFRCPSGVQ